ncbi:hypothetical protein RclHR1_02050030 [Rhizophagus clarus]|uniref:Uncharacterized protein n=1 Tax=Rhizophagus clarus TaxID=94130 RepID=A0A2Z6QRK4_9GLOM|nr:hypothetical protein RclHR1_02050030 [Rhizophagus clarus]
MKADRISLVQTFHSILPFAKTTAQDNSPRLKLLLFQEENNTNSPNLAHFQKSSRCSTSPNTNKGSHKSGNEQMGNLNKGKVISVSTRVHKKYLSVRVRLIPDHECLKYYNGGNWTVNLGEIPVQWFPASWSLSERKQCEKFQAVIYNILENITDASLFLNGRPHQFLLDSSIKSFKIIKKVDGSRKMIDYFDTWDHISTRINNP